MSPELIAIIAMFITLGGMLFNQSKKFDKMNDKIDANTKDLNTFKIEIKDDLTAFKIETTNNFAKVNDRFSKVDTRLSKIESKLDISAERYTTTNKKIDDHITYTREQFNLTNQRLIDHIAYSNGAAYASEKEQEEKLEYS